MGYLGIPAFIVTLGGLLVWRNVGWYLTRGQTIGPLDRTFMTFGGINGTLGDRSILGRGFLAVLSVPPVHHGALCRRGAYKIRHDFPVKPLWAEVYACGHRGRRPSPGFIAILNSYQIPTRRLERDV